MPPTAPAGRLAEELDEIWLGAGTVPDLDGLGALRGQPVRPGSPVRWDQVPGLCTGRLIAIGTGDHVSASLVLHEVGHALDAFDGMSRAAEWQTIMKIRSFRFLPVRHVEWCVVREDVLRGAVGAAAVVPEDQQ
ncbi:hypothetical protein GCM10010466_25790 [Planomonospora alba]|uniref:Uncharacterized protein n=1 Tax=Planomonospora alba TaxID=161354 RepID=A0ABP6N2A1_9ACTN